MSWWLLLALSFAMPERPADPWSSPSEVAALGCYLPLPDGYRVDPRDRAALTLLHPQEPRHSYIRFTAYEGEPRPDLWERTAARAVGALRLESFKLREERRVELGRDIEVVLLHDAHQLVSLVGRAAAHAEEMAKACARRPIRSAARSK